MLLLLGSGVSIASGLPRVGQITDALFSQDWHKHTTQLFEPGKATDWGMADPTESVKRFLRHIKGLADAWHAIRGVEAANYEDLFYIVKQIDDEECGQQRNAVIEPFISALRAELAAFPLNKGHSDAYDTPLIALSRMAANLLQSVVRHKLWTSNPPVGLQLVRDLAAREPTTIVTLNHDLLVERLLYDSGIKFADGFMKPDGEVRWFDENLLAPGKEPRLLKLHGSINWFLMARKGPDAAGKTVIPVHGDPWHCKTAAGESLSNWSGEPQFLTGVGNKVESYNLGIFAEMFFRFHEALKTTDTIVMSGYGWGDRGVNIRLVDWLLGSKKHRLVMLHENPEEFVTRLTPLTYRRDWLVAQGKLVEVRKWLQDVSIAELDALCASF